MSEARKMDTKYANVIKEVNTLLMLKECFKFIGLVYYGLDKKYLEKDEFEKKFGKVSPVVTDGKTIYFKLDDEFQTSKVIFQIIHSILHILSLHMKRKKNRDLLLWNIACDHVVNVQCRKLAQKYDHIELNKNCILFEDIYHNYPNITAEELYKKLEDDSSGQRSLQMSSSGGENSENNKHVKKITVKSDDNPKEMTAPMDLDEEQLKCSLNTDDISRNHESVHRKANSFWNTIKSTFLKGKGDKPGGLEEYLEKIFKIEIPWNKILENSILYSMQKKQRSTWTYPNLFIRYPRLTGKVQKSLDVYTLIASIDASGSISKDELTTFRNVLISCGSNYKNVYVIIHDTRIQQILNIRNPSEKKIFEELQKVRGRGGTSHRQVFEKIEELIDTEKVSSIIIQTDLYSDIEHLIKEKDYKFLRQYHTIWIVPKTSNKEVRLYGDSRFEVIRI
mgnify:CR=1 FL=1